MLIKKIVGIIAFTSIACGIASGSQALNIQSIGTYTFKPNEKITIENPLFFGVSASCAITINSANSQALYGHMSKGTGEINGQSVGHGLTINVSNRATMKIKASAGAKVDITNKGNVDVIAACGLGA